MIFDVNIFLHYFLNLRELSCRFKDTKVPSNSEKMYIGFLNCLGNITRVRCFLLTFLFNVFFKKNIITQKQKLSTCSSIITHKLFRTFCI